MAPEEGEKELRRSAPAAASKLRVPTQRKRGEALQKTATTEEDASTKHSQRETRRETSGIEGFRLSFSSGLPEPARYAWFQSGTGTGQAERAAGNVRAGQGTIHGQGMEGQLRDV